MPSIEPLQSITLDLPPSCIEFNPSDPQYAVVGTYNLEKEQGDQADHEEGQPRSQQRNGSLIFIKIFGDDIELIQTLPTPSAVLDIHFHPSHQSSFGVATSTGSIGIYTIQKLQSVVPKIYYVRTLQYFAEDVLITAFSWHPDGKAIGMTLSNGKVCLGSYNVESFYSSPPHVEILTHELEAWTLAHLPDGSGVLSGGDDCALRFTQLPKNPVEALASEEVLEPEYFSVGRVPWADTRLHGAGVTAILPIHCDEAGMLVVTGSYDDHIRLIHAATTGRRHTLSELNLGGGVWRFKVLEATSASQNAFSTPNELLLLVSCMHAGARIIRLFRNQDDWQFEVLAKFEEHKSMNYGSDAQPGVNERGHRTIVSTSFYDRLLCLWRFEWAGR